MTRKHIQGKQIRIPRVPLCHGPIAICRGAWSLHHSGSRRAAAGSHPSSRANFPETAEENSRAGSQRLFWEINIDPLLGNVSHLCILYIYIDINWFSYIYTIIIYVYIYIIHTLFSCCLKRRSSIAIVCLPVAICEGL